MLGRKKANSALFVYVCVIDLEREIERGEFTWFCVYVSNRTFARWGADKISQARNFRATCVCVHRRNLRSYCIEMFEESIAG